MSVSPKPLDGEYDRDFFAWSERQAALLRSLSSRDLPNELDLENIAEEIEALGRSELSTVESQLVNVLVHLLKTSCAPRSLAIGHWRVETLTFQASARRRYSKSMAHRINLDDLWREARKLAAGQVADFGDTLPKTLPKRCPLDLHELLNRDFDFDACLAILGRAIDEGVAPGH